MRIALIALLLAAFSVPLQAQIYKWTDANGVVHYSDQKPDNTATEVVKPKPINRLSDQDQPAASQGVLGKIRSWFSGITGSQADSIEQPPVEMYATQWCGYCRKAREHFAANNIAYVEYDIEYDADAKARYDGFRGRGVPVIFVNGKRLNGFDANRFSQLYSSR